MKKWRVILAKPRKLNSRQVAYLKINGHLDNNGHAQLYNLKGKESHKVHHSEIEVKKHKNGVHGISAVHSNGSKSHRFVGRKIQ